MLHPYIAFERDCDNNLLVPSKEDVLSSSAKSAEVATEL
jgi:hypothetical protein